VICWNPVYKAQSKPQETATMSIHIDKLDNVRICGPHCGRRSRI